MRIDTAHKGIAHEMTNDEARKIVASIMPQYRGRLTKEQVDEGVRLSQANALRLLNSARLLLLAGDAPTALSLSVLALEEHGKVKVLKSIGNAKNSEEVKIGWANYHLHRAKTVAFTEVYASLKGIVEGRALSEFCDKNSDLLPLVDLMKQLGFYTDCSGNCRWHDPKKIDTFLAGTMFLAAEMAIMGKSSNYQVPDRK